MSNYWKLWGGLIGSVIALGVQHTVIPVGVQEAWPMFWEALWPVVGALTGTVLSPPNTKA